MAAALPRSNSWQAVLTAAEKPSSGCSLPSQHRCTGMPACCICAAGPPHQGVIHTHAPADKLQTYALGPVEEACARQVFVLCHQVVHEVVMRREAPQLAASRTLRHLLGQLESLDDGGRLTQPRRSHLGGNSSQLQQKT